MAKFAMAFHCYQPVFNLEGEIEHAYRRAYMPLLRALEMFPGVKASFHFSGNMLEWFEARRPEYIELLKVLVRRGQIEILGGGCFEPVMAMIPEKDREEQINLNNEIITRMFGHRPRGMWLTERVWEPQLADTFARSGIEYTIVDDYHLLRAGLDEHKVFRPYLVRGESEELTLFPALSRLRYAIPFRKAEDTLDYMDRVVRRYSGDEVCFFFADDGEKFGAWPLTHKWVYGKGWLRDFLSKLEDNASWLKTATYSEVLDSAGTEEVGVLPGSSYAEMMEWSGGDFRNFLGRYRESDRMHKRMLSLSGTINALDPEKDGYREAKKELFKAQTSCAYWHGTFGGVYLPHLRSGVYGHLIKAQNIVKGMVPGGRRSLSALEVELDGRGSETMLSSASMDVFVRPHQGGAITELDLKALGLNLVNTMSRVREEYHEKLNKGYFSRIRKARNAAARGDFVDIHDVLGIGEKGLRKVLHYDDHERDAFLTHVFPDEKSRARGRKEHRHGFDGFLTGAYSSSLRGDGDVLEQTLERRERIATTPGMDVDLEVIKKITLGSGPAVMLGQRMIRHSGDMRPLRYAIEFNMLVWDKALMSRTKSARADRFSLKDRYSDICVDFLMDKESDIVTYPIYTVNETETGLRKTFQGVSVLIGNVLEGEEEDLKITIAAGR